MPALTDTSRLQAPSAETEAASVRLFPVHGATINAGVRQEVPLQYGQRISRRDNPYQNGGHSSPCAGANQAVTAGYPRPAPHVLWLAGHAVPERPPLPTRTCLCGRVRPAAPRLPHKDDGPFRADHRVEDQGKEKGKAGRAGMRAGVRGLASFSRRAIAGMPPACPVVLYGRRYTRKARPFSRCSRSRSPSHLVLVGAVARSIARADACSVLSHAV